ncbi:hypothetical protein FB451DRAFT_1296311 [Mycena latifolia]|nr:hypothetical protein FB451DRAFT_1296311 [Mycena latifolia]
MEKECGTARMSESRGRSGEDARQEASWRGKRAAARKEGGGGEGEAERMERGRGGKQGGRVVAGTADGQRRSILKKGANALGVDGVCAATWKKDRYKAGEGGAVEWSGEQYVGNEGRRGHKARKAPRGRARKEVIKERRKAARDVSSGYGHGEASKDSEGRRCRKDAVWRDITRNDRKEGGVRACVSEEKGVEAQKGRVFSARVGGGV